MEKFNRTLRGYNPAEVNRFLDQVIKQVEEMVNELKVKNERIIELEKVEQENQILRDKLGQYERMEETLNKAILMAQRTSDQIRSAAQQERETIIEDAKRNASRIVNEALLRAEKTEYEASMLRRNLNVFKRRLRDIIESQLEFVDDIEKIEL
ncbi:MAG: DivIVA domain-containing protein [Mollicutes bacterium]|nr:DivIVA domain-containing protein [Mollicutes bacterium]